MGVLFSMKKMKSLQLLVTSDIHGFIMPTTFRKTEENLGFAKAASIIEDLREKKHSLLIDNGDLLQGSPLTYYHQQFHAGKKNPVIDVANTIGYDLDAAVASMSAQVRSSARTVTEATAPGRSPVRASVMCSPR